MITVGLTGGIGSGKSTVAAGLVARGAELIDADAIVRELQQPGAEVFTAMVERFGETIVADDGSLDRPAVAGLVFSDDEARKALEGIVHPAVGREIRRRLEAAAGSDRVLVLDIPLLAEGRRQGRPSPYPLQAVVVVDVPTEIQVERLVEQRGFDADDARARIASQASRRERLELADRVVDNSGSVSDLDAQLDELWDWMNQLPPTPWPPADSSGEPNT